jgi:hypothetical protein
MVQAVDAVEHDGFAGAVGADDGVYLPLPDIKTHPGEGGYLSEMHVNIIYFQHYRPKLFRRHRAILLPEAGSMASVLPVHGQDGLNIVTWLK